MSAIIMFHVLIILFGLGIIGRVVTLESISKVLSYLHKSIGITTPSMAQTRAIALVWLGSLLIIVDGCLLLLVFIASSLH
jgi:hypothetical protein